MTCVGMAATANGIVSGGPPVGPAGIFSLGDPTQLDGLAKGAGFVDVTVEEIDVTFQARSIDDHVARVSSLAGPMAAILAAAPPDKQAALRATAAQLAAPCTADDGVAIPGRALLLSCKR